MILDEIFRDGTLTWQLVTEDADLQIQAGLHASLVRSEISFAMPDGWSPETLHSDGHALASVLALRPFIGSRLLLPRAVSRDFADMVRGELGIVLQPVDPGLRRRSVRSGRPGLAFSGGVDSVAAMSVLPDDCALVFLDRIRPSGVSSPSKYRPEAAHYACAQVEKMGREVYSIASDLEFARSPVGFPVFDRSAVESNGIGLVLLSDYLGLDAIAWGTTAEVAYGTGFGGFVDHALNAEHRAWRTVFAAASLDVISPLTGVSEVGALKLLEKSEFGGFAQSCVRGEPNNPCLNCWKCVRKTLTAAALNGEWPDEDEFFRLLTVREFRRQLRFTPVPLANVLSYSLARSPACAEVTKLLRIRLGIQSPTSEAYLEEWYSPAAELWPERYRSEITEELDVRLGRMGSEQERRFESWMPDAREEQEVVRRHALATVRYLDALAGDSDVLDDLVPLFRPYRTFTPDLSRFEGEMVSLQKELAKLTADTVALRSSRRYQRGNAIVRRVKSIAGKRSRNRHG